MGASRLLGTLVLVSLLLSSCDGGATSSSGTTTSTIPDDSGVTPIESSGAVAIELVSSDPPPGSQVSGCGDYIKGCVGRLRMTFRLTSPLDGRVDAMLVYLHATNQIACLIGETGTLSLTANVPLEVEVVLDRADAVDRCRTPLTMASLDAVFNATSGVASRQAWSIHYQFDP